MNLELPQDRTTAQASHVTFELHTLGWEAFQNLCSHIAREILGQTVTVYSPTNDAGQDGAFQGQWQKSKSEIFTGRFIIQCKFTVRRDEHLSLGDLNDELGKAERLAQEGLAETYLLVTNAKVTGESDRLIRERFLNVTGIKHFDLFGAEWLTQQILTSKRLRAFVPRIYGLGDLTQILDERVYRQADEILQTWRDNLAKFVPTDAHQKSVKALLEEGFVFLLGDPMAGKSTIAAALALAAADQWHCRPVFLSHPDEFKAHWNPDESKQFFWVDDVFGQTQYQASLAEGWNRAFPHLNAALRNGARVLFTSRTYVYKAAQGDLKESAFPLIKNSRVHIHVEDLTIQEKERILYNHLRLGTQSVDFRRAIKRFLPAIATNKNFFPEIAKRLGDPFFTKKVIFHEDYFKRFVEEPKEFLCDIIQELDRNCFAALALLFMRAGRIAIPLRIEQREEEAMSVLGASRFDLFRALHSLNDSLVTEAFETGERFWKFRHPSIRDAMAVLLAKRSELLDVYLARVNPRELLSEVVCGDVQIEGAKMHVPQSRFNVVISKLRDIKFDEWLANHNFVRFMTRRCSGDFLTSWSASCPEQLKELFRIFSVADYSFCFFIARLHELGCLPEELRKSYVKSAITAALNRAESNFLEEDFRSLMTPEEFDSTLQRIEYELAPSLDGIVDDWVDKYSDPDENPSDYFDDLRSNFESFQEHFENSEIGQAFAEGKSLIESAIERLEERNAEREQEKDEEDEAEGNAALRAAVTEFQRQKSEQTKSNSTPNLKIQVQFPPRNIFDDVDS